MKTWMVIFSLIVTAQAQAWYCSYERDIEETLDVSDSEILIVNAGAGELEITGVPGADEARIIGKVCASEEEWLDQAGLDTVPGRNAEINVVLPQVDGGWSLFGGNYAFMDLDIRIPEGLYLQIRDSSGDIELENIAAANIHDGSGDIEIDRIGGAVEIVDSSGDIEVTGLEGDLTISSDSSGDIFGKDIKGTARVLADSSGDIRFVDVGKDVVVEQDSSGEIIAERIGGDFTVLNDSSGGIYSEEVQGEVRIPDHKR